jgi:hypothetical protein
LASLEPVVKDGFEGSGVALVFERDAHGTITGFRLSMDRVRRIRYRRVPR